MRRNYLAVLLIASLCVIATPAQSDVVSADTKMSLVKTITGDISPKSVRSSGNGLSECPQHDVQTQCHYL